jgi:hypothetical protein
MTTNEGQNEFPMFATSWLLTMFSHDIECFDNLQRLFDAILAGDPDLVLKTILATLMQHKEALQVSCREDDISTAPFVVFRTPLRHFNNSENVETII